MNAEQRRWSPGCVPAGRAQEAASRLCCPGTAGSCPARCPTGPFGQRRSPGRPAPARVAAGARPPQGRALPSALLSVTGLRVVPSSGLAGSPLEAALHLSASTGTFNSVSSEYYTRVQAVTSSRSWTDLSSAHCGTPLVTGLRVDRDLLTTTSEP